MDISFLVIPVLQGPAGQPHFRCLVMPCLPFIRPCVGPFTVPVFTLGFCGVFNKVNGLPELALVVAFRVTVNTDSLMVRAEPGCIIVVIPFFYDSVFNRDGHGRFR